MKWARVRWCAMCLLTVAIGMFVEPAAGQSIVVSGNWSSNLGAVAFRQSGNQITGSLRFSNGAVASLAGTLQGRSLHFRWSVNQQAFGDGSLTLDASGNRLSGRYADRGQGTSGVFDLT